MGDCEGAPLELVGQWPDLTFACVGTPDALMRCDDGLTLGGSHDNAINFIC